MRGSIAQRRADREIRRFPAAITAQCRAARESIPDAAGTASRRTPRVARRGRACGGASDGVALAAAARMSMLYLYAFVRPSADVSALAGVEAESTVFVVAADDVGCAVSCVPDHEYGAPQTATMSEQLEWITPRALRHHEVVAHLHRGGAALPLKFGTLCPDVDTLRGLLVERRDGIEDGLGLVRGRDEWTLAVSVDQQAIAATVLERSPHLAALQAEANRLPEGRAYFARRRVQKAVADEVANACAALEQRICGQLAGLDVAHKLGSPSRDRGAQPVTVLSLLVDRGRLSTIESMLAHAELEAAASGLTCEITGPWPAYSFAPRWDAEPAAARQ
ncbi:MAG TPA: GvpL/GvpF family gas vesicle protein [Vicinamibacterales bacterium]|jgi:hypothetical protein